MKNGFTRVLILLMIVAAVAGLGYMKLKEGSVISFEAVVIEVKSEGSNSGRIIVQRTADMYSDSFDALGIGPDTVFKDEKNSKIAFSDIKAGNKIKVKALDAFTEEEIFFYPEVYSITLTEFE